MKRLLIAVVAVLAVVGGIVAAIPALLSTPIVKQRFADQIADWTGRKVTFRGDPSVAAFPYLRLSVSDVTIGDRTGDKPFISMDRLSADMKILPLLLGQIEINEFRLTKPSIHFRQEAQKDANWNLRQVPRDKRRPGPKTLLRLSRLVLYDGTITYDDETTGQHEEVTAATLDLSWPGPSDPLVGVGTFTWRGETVEFNGSVNDPIALNEGKISGARFAIASTPIRASFNGNVNRFADLQVEGETTVSTPSLRRLIGWLGAPMDQGSTLGSASISGTVNWRSPSASMAGAHIELDGNVAEGTVSVGLDKGRPLIRGTLAADKLDLSPYLEAFHAELNTSPWGAAAIRMPALAAADVDLRLSTDQVILGPARIGSVAIAAGVDKGKLSVDIGNAQIYSGTLAATMTGEMQGDVFAGGVEAKMTGVPAGAMLTDLAGIKSIDGTGAATIKLASSGESWGEFAHKLAGTGKVSLADGTLAGFDLSRIAAVLGRDAVAGSGGNGSTAISSATATMKIAEGAISTDDLHAEGPNFRIDLSGQASMLDASVNGRGTLTLGKAGDSGTAVTALPFELGGTWDEPELLPDLGRILTPAEPPPTPRG
jgi:AsmA protein